MSLFCYHAMYEALAIKTNHIVSHRSCSRSMIGRFQARIEIELKEVVIWDWEGIRYDKGCRDIRKGVPWGTTIMLRTMP